MKEVFTATQHHMSADRRAFLKVATAAGLGLAGVALSSTTSFAQDSPTIGTDPGAQMMNPSNAKEFAMAVIKSR